MNIIRVFNKFFVAINVSNLRPYTVSAQLHFPRNRIVFEEPEDLNQIKHVLKIAILGVPNSGKSTLVNQIMSRRVCAVSKKVHTTTKKSSAICISGDTQLIFLDTPGLVSLQESKRHNLQPSFIQDALVSIKEADLLAVVHDASNKWTRDAIDKKVLTLLKSAAEKPSILILNKVDAIKSKRTLLDLAQTLSNRTLKSIDKPFPCVTNSKTESRNSDDVRRREENKNEIGWSNFSEIFMVSALNGSGVGDIKEYMLSLAKPGKWRFPQDTYTDQTPQEIAELAVREKFLEHLPKEIPYQIKTKLEFWEESHTGILYIVVIAECPVKRHSSILIKNKGAKISLIAREAEEALSNTFRCPVKLRVVVEEP